MMTPTTEAELAQMVADATGPITVQGGGTRGLPSDGLLLSTTGLSGIELYEPGALTVVVKAGTPVAEIETELAKENQRLAFEPVDFRGLIGSDGIPTIGGILATNNAGPRRLQVGAARDFALGVRYVDGMGQTVSNGGRVMKNVTGYDLVKLMAGSWGTLGVMSQLSLKVLPNPETEATLTLHGLAHTQAVAAMAEAMGSSFDVSGAAHADIDGTPLTAIRVEGFAKSVTYRITELTERLRHFGAEMSVAENSAALWSDLRHVKGFHGTDGDVWRVSVKPSDGPALIAAAGARGAQMDWAGGLVWLRMAPGTDLRARMGDIAGHATLIRGTGFARFHPEDCGNALLTTGLRHRFDPKGLFNPVLAAA